MKKKDILSKHITHERREPIPAPKVFTDRKKKAKKNACRKKGFK